MEVNKRFFDDLLKDRGLSLRQLSKRMDILPSQMSLTLNGKRRMQISEAVKIAQILGAPINEVMINAGIEAARSDRRRCDVLGILQGDGSVAAVQGSERTIAPEGLPEDCQAVQARTAESPLGWMDGWVFFCSGKQEPKELVGRFCWIKIEGGPEVLATIRRGYDPGTYTLMGPLASREMVSQRIEWAAPVVLTRH